MEHVTSAPLSLPSSIISHISSFLPNHLNLRCISQEWNKSVRALHSDPNGCQKCITGCSPSSFQERRSRVPWMKNWKFLPEITEYEELEHFRKAVISMDSQPELFANIEFAPITSIQGQFDVQAPQLQAHFLETVSSSSSLASSLKSVGPFHCISALNRTAATTASKILTHLCALKNLKSLSFCSFDFDFHNSAASVESLVSSLNHLNSLEIRSSKLRDASVLAALVSSPSTSNLTSLSLVDCEITPAGARTVLSSPYLANLRTLTLECNLIGDENAQLLAQSSTFGKLTSLNLNSCGIGDKGLAAIALSPYLAQVKALALGGNEFSGQGIAKLLSVQSTLVQVEKLFLTSIEESVGTSFLDTASTMIVSCSAERGPNSGKLKELVLENFEEFGSEGAMALAMLPRMNSVTALNLVNCNVDSDGMRAIASPSSQFLSLKFVTLSQGVVPIIKRNLQRLS